MADRTSPIRILTVDDHPLARQGIAALVGVQPDMTLVGEGSSGREAVQQFRTQDPDFCADFPTFSRPRATLKRVLLAALFGLSIFSTMSKISVDEARPS